MTKNYREIEDLFSGYFSGELSEKERELVDLWRRESSENEKIFKVASAAWGSVLMLDEMEKYNSFGALKAVNSRLPVLRPIRWMFYFQRFAALVLLPLLIYAAYMEILITRQRLSSLKLLMLKNTPYGGTIQFWKTNKPIANQLEGTIIKINKTNLMNMNRLNLRNVVLSVLFFWAGSLSAQTFLHTDGLNIVDESGKKIVLQGVGLGNWMLPEGYMWKFGENGDRPRKIEKIVEHYLGAEKAEQFWKTYRKNYITETDIRRIAELGYNSVRPALNSRLFMKEGGNNEFVDEGFQLLDSLVARCKKHHLYVIIDMHGAPGGQTGQNIDDSPNDVPELFTNPANQDLLVKLWVKIADRYKDEPTIAAYDLLNEPLPERTGAAEKYKDQLIVLYQKLITAIRAIDKKHMFTLEGYNWANNWSMFDKPMDSNTFYQFHYYCWDNPDNLNDISGFLKKQKQLNTPVWVGETGERNTTIYFATSQYFEKNNIGWSFWPWKKMDTSNTPYSYKSPTDWKAVTTYSRGGEPIAITNPEATFNELLENIKLENCTYFPDVVNAMMRRIPLKLEAENYGHDGYQISYLVNDTLKKSVTYRKKEPVKIQVIGQDKRSSAGQYVELNSGEWTAYKINSPDKMTCKVSLQIKTAGQPAELALWINGKSNKVKVSQTEWTELKLNPQSFKKGENELKVEVTTGSINLDWINISE